MKYLIVIIFLFLWLPCKSQLIPGVVASSISDDLAEAVSSWKFEEASGNAIDDINDNDATMSNVTYQQTGKLDYCYSYNGSSSYGNIGQPSELNLDPKSDAMSIVAWFRSNGGSGYIVSKGDADGATRQYNMYSDGNYLNCNMSGGTWTAFTTVNISDDAWHFIVITSPGNGNDGHAYIDGDIETTTIPMGTASPNSIDILIGARRVSGNTGLAAYLTGMVDELRIYNIELSQAQVTALYNAEY